MKNKAAPTVMMLDDELFLIEMYRKSFEKKGYQVATFIDPKKALEFLREGNKPDIILFDITMPNMMSGYEFIDIVQTEKLAKHSLKVALTNEAGEATISRLIRELGVDAFLHKAEFIPSELVAKVDEMLGRK